MARRHCVPLHLLLLLASAVTTGCGPGYSEIVPVFPFPTDAELGAVDLPSTPAVESLARSERAELSLPSELPAFGAGTAAAPDGPVAAALRAAGRVRVTSTVGMACAASAIAALRLEDGAVPPPPLVEFILGRCGVTVVDPWMAVHASAIEAPIEDDAIEAGHAQTYDRIASIALRRPVPFEVEVGSAFAASDTQAVWVTVAGSRRATLSAARLDGGRFLVTGRLASERLRSVEAWMNIGDYGVARCEPDDAAALPDLRFICVPNRHDVTTRVDLVGTPRQRFMTQRVASVLLHRDDEGSRTYRPQPSLPLDGIEGARVTARTRLAAAIAAAREEAGRDGLAFQGAESDRQAPLLAGLRRARAAGDGELTERFVLGLLAGWAVEGPIAGAAAHFIDGHVEDPAALLQRELAKPMARAALFDPAADRVAMALDESESGLHVGITLYRPFDPERIAVIREAWLMRINAARRDFGVGPVRVIEDVDDLQQEADKVTAGEVHPRKALEDALARLRGRLGRTVRGHYVEAYDPMYTDIPADFADSGTLEVVTGVAWHRPEGAAWGQWVLYVCAFPQ